MSIRFLRLGLISPLLFSISMTVKAQAFESQQLGDSELTCQEIYDEVKRMDAMIRDNAPGAAPTTAGNQGGNSAAKALADAAAREARTVEGAQISNFLGRLASGFGTADPQQLHQQQEANKAQARSSAQARKQYLTSQFNSKKCKVSTLRK
jgi:hypothetical protein